MSYLTFRNATRFIAQFVLMKGDLVVARLPGMAPQAEIEVPSDEHCEVRAVATLENCIHRSAPVQVEGASSFLAQVVQDPVQGACSFQLVVGPAAAADQMVFQKTTLGPVTFNISKNGKLMQSVVVPDSFVTKSLAISDTCSIYAVINGVTTGRVTTGDPSATITAVTDNADLEAGYFNLVVT